MTCLLRLLIKVMCIYVLFLLLMFIMHVFYSFTFAFFLVHLNMYCMEKRKSNKI